MFSGGHPNLRKHSFKNASKNIVPEKKELYFWESSQTWKNTASKIIVPEKKELYFREGTQTWENTVSKKLPKLKFREKRNYIFGSVPQRAKKQLQKL